jgi:hypothetical protein
MSINTFFKDKHGHVVIVQKPNKPILGWIIATVIAHFVHNKTWHSLISSLGIGFLIGFAYLEITEGVNYFRRTLGAAVLVTVLVGVFVRTI